MLNSGFIVAAILAGISLAFIHDFWKYCILKSLKKMSVNAEVIISVMKELVAILIALWIFEMCQRVFEQHSPSPLFILCVILFVCAYIGLKLHNMRK